MRSLYEFLNTNVKPNIIHATDETIQRIVKSELDRLGHDASLNHIDVSEVTRMNSLFSCDYSDLGPKYDMNPDISLWNVSNVTNMQCMFYNCENFNQDLSQWAVIKVEDMSRMFWGCEKFNKDLSGWDVSNVEDMMGMFEGCKKFNQDLSGWNVKKAKLHNYMFDSCPIKEEFKPKFN